MPPSCSKSISRLSLLENPESWIKDDGDYRTLADGLLYPPTKNPVVGGGSCLRLAPFRVNQCKSADTRETTCAQLNGAQIFRFHFMNPTYHFHELKSALTEKSGWDLKFPDSNQFWQARAIHTTRNSPDWHLSTESEGERTSLKGERDHTLIIIWNESSFLR